MMILTWVGSACLDCLGLLVLAAEGERISQYAVDSFANPTHEGFKFRQSASRSRA